MHLSPFDLSFKALLTLMPAQLPFQYTCGGGSKGCQEQTTPRGPIFIVFVQFSTKIGQNIRLASPPLGLVPLRLVNPGSATD